MHHHRPSSARIRKRRFKAVCFGALPAQCAALNRTFLNVVELTVRAALEEDRELVHQAALLDPNASASLDLDTIRTVCDELLEAHADALARGLQEGRASTGAAESAGTRAAESAGTPAHG